MFKLVLSLLAFVMSCCLHADLNKELNSFFNKIGAHANVSSGDIYKGQKAGYFTGGGVIMRNRVMQSKLASINLPRFDAGCGGIDVFSGGFSFISEAQLVNTLKSIGSSAVGYAFLLGLESYSPQIANTIKQLQSWSNSINNTNINSCEAASQMVGAVWPRNTMASQHICRSVGGKSGRFSDWVAARHKCGQEAEFDKQMDSVKKNTEFKDLLGDEYNIAWEAIKKQEYLASNNDLSELVMTLLGTLVVRKDGQTHVETWPSKIRDEGFLKALMEGGEAEVYKCTQDGTNLCLLITIEKRQIGHENSWIGHVYRLLGGFQKQILNDEELTEEQIELLTKSRLPLYKIVNVMTAYKKGFCPIDLYAVADIVAMDLMLQYLQEVVTLVREGAQQLRRGQMFSGEINDYLREIDQIEAQVRTYETRAMNLMEREIQTMKRLQMVEDHIAAEIVLN